MTEKKKWFNKNVWGMGLASLLSDASHEMATAILPMFLATIGASAAALGAIEGLADAASSFVKLWSGWYSDRIGKRKAIAVTGYVITGISKATFALATLWQHVLIGRVVGWMGRGLRGPVRDAMLADSVPPEAYGRAFGFHRAMDTAGAVLGPFLALIFIKYFSLRAIFMITLIPGLLSAAAIAFLVKDRYRTPNHAMKFFKNVADTPRSFKLFLGGVFIFGMGDFAHTLLILRATQILTPAYGVAKAGSLAISLYVVHNILYALSAYPVGALSDKLGRRELLALGYLLSGVMCIGFILAPPGFGYLLILFVLGGIYIAVEDALEGSTAAELLPEEVRGTGYGMLATVNGIGDFVSSLVVGFLWSTVSPAAGFGYAAGLSILGALVIYKV